MSDDLRGRLESATKGLWFSTESDRPFEFVRFAGVRTPVESLTPAAVAELAGMPGARTTEWPVERFLARHIERADPADAHARELIPRYESLREVLAGAFPTVRVFRAGSVEVRVLALGNDPATGELAGLATVAVET